MIRYLCVCAAALACALVLTGCSTAGLNVSWSATMTYNTDATVTTKAVHQTSPVPAAPASAASGAK